MRHAVRPHVPPPYAFVRREISEAVRTLRVHRIFTSVYASTHPAVSLSEKEIKEGMFSSSLPLSSTVHKGKEEEEGDKKQPSPPPPPLHPTMAYLPILLFYNYFLFSFFFGDIRGTSKRTRESSFFSSLLSSSF